MTDLTQPQQVQIAALVEAIYEHDYYVNLFERVCGKPDAAIPLHNNPKAYNLLNQFWYRLPDTPSIRTPVFFQLCDVLEGEMPEEPYDGEDEPAF